MKDLKANKFFFGTLATFFLFGLFLLFFFGVFRLQAQAIQRVEQLALNEPHVIGESAPLVKELLIGNISTRPIEGNSIETGAGPGGVILNQALLSADLLDIADAVLALDLELKAIEPLDGLPSLHPKSLLQNGLENLSAGRLITV